MILIVYQHAMKIDFDSKIACTNAMYDIKLESEKHGNTFIMVCVPNGR